MGVKRKKSLIASTSYSITLLYATPDHRVGNDQHRVEGQKVNFSVNHNTQPCFKKVGLTYVSENGNIRVDINGPFRGRIEGCLFISPAAK